MTKQRTPVDLGSDELNRIATEAFTEAARRAELTKIDATPEELLAWADGAQAFIDGNSIVIDDIRKAHATVAAIRAAARTAQEPMRTALEAVRDYIVAGMPCFTAGVILATIDAALSGKIGK